MSDSFDSEDNSSTISAVNLGTPTDSDTFVSVWLVNLLEFVIEISGLVFNCLICDTSIRLPVTSGSIWMRYLAAWDNVYLAVAAANCVTKFFKMNLATVSNISCKMIIYFTITTKINATSHLAAFALDRVVNLKFPIWHYGKNWSNKIKHVC